MAAILLMRLGAGLADARESRFAASGGGRLASEVPFGAGIGDGSASGLHVARSDCHRWRAAAATLGETYAGHLLRETVVQRQCRSLEADRGDEAWDWPWASLQEGRTLPPRLHAAQGEWEIRCGNAGGRRRCALLNRSPVPPDETLEPGDDAIITHFVIDMIAGRETLLWRLFVPTAPFITAAAAGLIDAGATHKGIGQRKGEVRYRLEDAERTELFPACTAAGCLMESGPRTAGDVATRLWEGRSIDVRISLTTAPAVALTLPSAGFRAGLKELVRLRREEMRAGGD
jgi:hypothetical protein